MIAGLIRWSINNRFLVLLATGLLVAWGIYSLKQTPVDALPDLSDVQVIVKTSFPRPGAAGCRGPGDLSVDDRHAGRAEGGDRSRLFVLRTIPTCISFSRDGTDLYWARSRVLEYLNQVAA